MALDDPMTMLRGLVNASPELMLKLAVNRLFDYFEDENYATLSQYDIMDIIAQVLIFGDARVEPSDAPTLDELKAMFRDDLGYNPDEEEETNG